MYTGNQVRIETFSGQAQQAIADLVLSIQQKEFGIPITLADQPELSAIEHHFQKGNGNFWLAFREDQVVGTIGLLDIGNQQVALRKMFVDQEVRGSHLKIAWQLLHAAIDWCQQHAVTDIYLGTIDRYQAAQHFYEKNGFSLIDPKLLPSAFPRMQVDNRFYHLSLRMED